MKPNQTNSQSSSIKPKDKQITLFIGGAKAVTPKKVISFSDIPELALSDRQKELTAKIVAATDKDEKDTLKRQSPFVTPYGVFSYRNNQSIVEHNNNIVAFDFDGLESKAVAEKLKAILSASKSCLLCFISPRQRGVKAIFLINDTIPLSNHYQTLKANEANLLQAIGAIDYLDKNDLSQFKLSQPLFLAYDGDLYYNDKPEPLNIQLITGIEPERKYFAVREWDSSILERKKFRILKYVDNAVSKLCLDFENVDGARHPNIIKVQAIASLILSYNLPNEQGIYDRLENSVIDMYGGVSEARAGNAFNSFKDAWNNAKAKQNDTIEAILNESENKFPIHAFPDLFKAYALDLQKTLNYPIDYTATAVLTAVATAAGGNVKLKVKDNWLESGALFTSIIGNAGANKSHPINTVFAPIKDLDRERHENFVYEYEAFQSYEKLSKKDKELAESIFAPVLEKSILSNFTTEILFKRLSENPRGCTVLSDELISFLEGMNNYSKSDQIGFYLSVWSNQSTTVDRVGSAIPLFIDKPYLSIIGGLQPRALSKAFPPDKINNGFFQRFLFAYPDEAKKQPLNDNKANPQLSEAYEAFIYRLLAKSEPRVLTFTPEAKAFFYDWQTANCEQVNANQSSIKGEILSKYDNHFLRLSLIMQLMENPESETVEIGAVEAAKVLCEYYIACAFKVLAEVRNKANYVSTLSTEKQQLYNELETNFTTSEANEIGSEIGMHERTIRRFLRDVQVFKKLAHGKYQKN